MSSKFYPDLPTPIPDESIAFANLPTYNLVSLSAARAAYFAQAFVHLSPKTRHWHSTRLNTFFAHLDADIPVLAISIVQIAAALQQINNHNPPYAASYRHSISRAVKYFFRWLTSTAILPVDPTLGLRLPRLPRAGRKGLSDSDAAAILSTCTSHGFFDIRDRAILRLLETTGARLSGIANLTLADISQNLTPIWQSPFTDHQSPFTHLDRRLILHEKFDKERTVFMTPGALNDLVAWFIIRPGVHPSYTKNRVFLTHYGTPLNTRAIDMMIRRRAALANVAAPCSAHQWRHRFARKLAERGLPLGQVAQLMGHTDVSITVDYYGIFAVSELQDGYDRYMTDLESESAMSS